jgi:hypothetical protein
MKHLILDYDPDTGRVSFGKKEMWFFPRTAEVLRRVVDFNDPDIEEEIKDLKRRGIIRNVSV